MAFVFVVVVCKCLRICMVSSRLVCFNFFEFGFVCIGFGVAVGWTCIGFVVFVVCVVCVGCLFGLLGCTFVFYVVGGGV